MPPSTSEAFKLQVIVPVVATLAGVGTVPPVIDTLSKVTVSCAPPAWEVTARPTRTLLGAPFQCCWFRGTHSTLACEARGNGAGSGDGGGGGQGPAGHRHVVEGDRVVRASRVGGDRQADQDAVGGAVPVLLVQEHPLHVVLRGVGVELVPDAGDLE